MDTEYIKFSLIISDIAIIGSSIIVIAISTFLTCIYGAKEFIIMMTACVMLFIYQSNMIIIHLVLYMYMPECTIGMFILITCLCMLCTLILSAITGWLIYMMIISRRR